MNGLLAAEEDEADCLLAGLRRSELGGQRHGF